MVKRNVYPKNTLNTIIGSLFIQEVSFKFILYVVAVVVVVQFRQAYLKNLVRYKN